MRQTQIFSGSSHPTLVEGICDRLGQKPGLADLTKFSNGETSVTLKTSIRDQDVFIVQSGSGKINDNVVELLIMISACKGGSAKSVTAVMPYFPYCRQSKKKSHRGAITGRMLANLLSVAGVNHVITIDLHASQMQGFFKCPVDNLVAEPLLARWIRTRIPNWQEAVVVSKNPGGTKRVTSLADAMKLSFGIVTTDRRRRPAHEGYASMSGSMVFDKLVDGLVDAKDGTDDDKDGSSHGSAVSVETPDKTAQDTVAAKGSVTPGVSNILARRASTPTPGGPPPAIAPLPLTSSASMQTPAIDPDTSPENDLRRSRTVPTDLTEVEEEFTDERANHVAIGRLVHGHIVDELVSAQASSPAFSSSRLSAAGTPRFPRIAGVNSGTNSGHGGSSENGDVPDHMISSFMSTASSVRDQNGMGGNPEAGATSEEEEEELSLQDDALVTLVGNVQDRPVFLVDDIIDSSTSWIAAAETAVKRGGATKVYCFATHGLFGGDCLEELESCPEIEKIVVTNSFPIPSDKRHQSRKLVVLDVAPLLSEAIRRNHHGESISQLYMHDAGW